MLYNIYNIMLIDLCYAVIIIFLLITCIIQKQENSLYFSIHFPPLSLVFYNYVTSGKKLLLKG
jgi:hypothetical protein